MKDRETLFGQQQKTFLSLLGPLQDREKKEGDKRESIKRRYFLFSKDIKHTMGKRTFVGAEDLFSLSLVPSFLQGVIEDN